MDKVQISKGNRKTGRIPAVSLSPIKACGKDVPCKKDCYAVKCTRYSPQAKASWTRNLDLALTNREQYFGEIEDYLTRRKPRFFRWHIAGDILDQDYLDRMLDIARVYPETKFLAFTKKHYLNYALSIKNLNIIFSMWPDWGDTTQKMPRAWMRDEKNLDERIPKSSIECPGNCETCGMCWSLKSNQNVVFNKH